MQAFFIARIRPLPLLNDVFLLSGIHVHEICMRFNEYKWRNTQVNKL